MSDKAFKHNPSSLRSPERIAILEVEKVVELCLEGIFITEVLDVGSGSGIFSEAFALRNLDVQGIDTNPEMVRIASKLVENAKFKEAVAEDLPFEDSSFDLVFLAHVLHESDDPLLVLKEAKRIARTRIAVLEWPYVEETKGPPLSHRLPQEQIEKMASEAGFKDITITPLTHMVLYRFNCARDRKPKKRSGRRPKTQNADLE